mgnify:CR=1 FL=1
MSSYSEKRALKLIDEEPGEFVKHTNLQLCRIYPAGTRTDSSNYSPIDMWNVGCQLGMTWMIVWGISDQLYRRLIGWIEKPLSRSYHCKASFPGLFFYIYIESPNLKKPRRPHTTGPKPHQLKTPTPKTQTTMNEQKWEESTKNNPGKNDL